MTSEGNHYKLFHNGGSTGPVDETADILVHFFVNRLDTYAVQLEDGQYLREDAALLREVMLQHLKGDITVGAYLVNPQDQTTKCLCFDVDPEHVKDPQQAAATLYNECTFRFSKRAVLLEASRWPDPSFHVWVVFEPPIPAKAARFLGRKIMEHAGVVVELFPKQDEVRPGDFGNLVKLPLGYHRREKKWSKFLAGDFTPIDAKTLMEVEGCTFSERSLERILKWANRETSGVQVKLDKGVRTPYKGSRKVRPCFREALKDHALSHDMRLALAVEYLAAGYDVDRVTALFQEQEKFDERRTRYQIEHASNREYRPRKCVTIQALGYCLGEPCSIFRRRRRRFERIGVF